MSEGPPPKKQRTIAEYFVHKNLPGASINETPDVSQRTLAKDTASADTEILSNPSSEGHFAPNDIGLVVRDYTNLTAEDRQKFISPWKPSSRQDYPFSERGGKTPLNKEGVQRIRRLLPSHIEKFPWLAVSKVPGVEGVFCAPCVLFMSSCPEIGGRSGHCQSAGKLVRLPLKDFHQLTGKDGDLTKHQKTTYHQNCMDAMTQFQATQSRSKDDIQTSLSNAHRKQVQQNRAILAPIVDTIITCARQNIPFRGHRNETGAVNATGMEPEENDGNFRALLRYRIRGGDQILQSHSESAASNATYMSPLVQNELITIAGDLAKESIASRIKASRFWAIISDETTDRHHREQLAVVIRYVSPDKSGTWKCYEDLVGIVDLISDIRTDEGLSAKDEIRLTGKRIGETLLRIVNELGLDLSACVGQSYDGASVLSSERVGAASRFQENAPHAFYQHCAMHCLNLSASKSIDVPAISHAQSVVHDTTSSFRQSAKRSELLKTCILSSEEREVAKTQLIALCNTRFVERHTSVICFRSLIEFVMESLEIMMTWKSADARKTALHLKNSICQPDFIVALVILEKLSGLMLPATRLIQSSGIDLIEAMDAVSAMMEAIRCLRSPDEFKKVFAEIEATASTLGISLEKPRIPQRSVYRSNAGGSSANVEDYYRINVFYPAIDSIINDLDRRFGPTQLRSLRLSKLIPACMDFKNDDHQEWTELRCVLFNYRDLFDDPLEAIEAEYSMWRRKWQRSDDRPKTAISALDHCRGYPNISVILQMLSTFPIVNAEAERMFSRMEKTLTNIRASMDEHRLESLIVLQVHRGDTPSTDAIIDRFAATSSRRLKFVL